MTIRLNKESAAKHGITLDEALYMIIIHNKINLELTKESLIQKGLLTADRNETFQQIGWRLTNRGTEVLDSTIIDSDKPKGREDDFLLEIAAKLKEIFPKGKKDGTNYYWAEGTALIVRRLKLFFKKYEEYIENEFKEESSNLSKEEFNKFIGDKIVYAASKYVNSFNGNYRYMKLLKYFILKEKVGAAGEVEGESELMNYIENYGQEEDLRNDWTSTLL
jgi:hypothetical protein